MGKIKAIWQLMRAEHGIMLFIAIIIGAVIAQKMLYNTAELLPYDKLVLTFFTAFFLEASTFALNDYFDVAIDKKNKRTDRPLVRGDISPTTALLIFGVLFPLGIISSYFVNSLCFFIAVITGLLAIVYDIKMKKIKLLGNFYIAYTMAIPFIFGGAAVVSDTISFSSIPSPIILIAMIAFLAGVGREIMKDVMDYKGDKETGVKSFPRYIGIRAANMVAAFFYIAAIILSFLPYSLPRFGVYYKNSYYLMIVFITNIMLLTTALQLLCNPRVKVKAFRKYTLIAVFIGLIAFLVGVFTG